MLKKTAYIVSILIWLLGLILPHLIDFHKSHLNYLSIQGHTAQSIWIRLCSAPLRLVISMWILNKCILSNVPTAKQGQDIKWISYLWMFASTYYSIDLLIDQFSNKYLMLIGCSIGIFLLLYLNIVLTNFLKYGLSILFIFLSILINAASVKNGSNNAFTTFGLQGLGLIWAIWKPNDSARILTFLYLAPALGYVFPVIEKLLLNPVGWLSGNTLQAYGHIFKMDVNSNLALTLSLAILTFQLAFIYGIDRHSFYNWLYPLAILFHLIAGIVLNFNSALNPWIVSLMIGLIAIKLQTHKHNQSNLESTYLN